MSIFWVTATGAKFEFTDEIVACIPDVYSSVVLDELSADCFQ